MFVREAGNKHTTSCHTKKAATENWYALLLPIMYMGRREGTVDMTNNI